MLEIFISIVFMIIGLVLLIKGADFLIDGAADFARWLKVPPIIIGLTIVAFGTSLPEFIVSLIATLQGKADLSIGNIIGSNIVNIGLGIGLAAIFLPLVIHSKTLIYEMPFLLFSGFLLLIFSSNTFIFQENTFSLDRIDGFMLLIIFLIFLYYIFKSIQNERKRVKTEFREKLKEELKEGNSLWKNIILMSFGLLGLIIGGKVFLRGAEDAIFIFGVSQAFIGLTIAAIGTSLPEIITSIRGAMKGHGDIVIGNIMGSSIFNVFFVLGLTSLIKPIPINPSLLAIDGMVMIFITMAFLLFATTNQVIKRWEGMCLTLIYLSYFAFLIWRL